MEAALCDVDVPAVGIRSVAALCDVDVPTVGIRSVPEQPRYSVVERWCWGFLAVWVVQIVQLYSSQRPAALVAHGGR